MTWMNIREVPPQELIDAKVFPQEEIEEFKKIETPMHAYGGYIDDKPVFYCGIINFGERAGEVWSKIVDMNYAMSAVHSIRELLDYVIVRYDYKLVIASVLKEDPDLHRWITWMGFERIGDKEAYGYEYDVFQWRKC